MLDDAAREAVRRALAEDLGSEGDVTTEAVVPPGTRARAGLIAGQEAVLSGTEAFEAAFRMVDPDVQVEWAAKDGDAVGPGDLVARVEGPLRAILGAERTALNFLQRLSGVATLTRRFVETASGVEVRDTRKTTPGLRSFEKAAVRAGGGANHRMGLFQGHFLKDNHIAACGGVGAAVERARSARPGLRIQVECETLAQVREAIEAGADELLLDNMDLETLTQAVRIVAGRARTEASGGVTLETVAAIARTGVDAVSVGALTHSAPAVDFSLELEGGSPPAEGGTDAPRG